jgi:protein-disulfide isomerase
VGGYGFHEFHATKKQAQSGGAAARIVEQYFSLPTVKLPSTISPYWTARATERFEDAPIQVIEYADFLCPDCLYLSGQLEKLRREFKGRINIAYQFFPLESKCNHVVAKDKHPGACELAYIAAQDPAKFAQIHDEIFGNFAAAKKPEWRKELAKRHGVESALEDAETQRRVRQIIETGAEYEKTSDQYAHGVRSTPTMIINNRMVIGTFPYEQLRAIFQAVVERKEPRKFIENWQETGK